MKLGIRYPVVFEGEVPRHHQTKTVIGFASTGGAIPELSDAEAPIMITVHDVDSEFGVTAGTEFRVNADRFLVDTGITPEQFSNSEEQEVRKLTLLPLLQEIRFKHDFGDGLHIYPPKALQVITGMMWNGGIASDLADTWRHMIEAGKLGIDSANEAADAWKEMLDRHLASFAIIDGSVWREAAEPCYTVNRDLAPGLTTRESSFFLKLRKGTLESSDWLKYRTQGRNFSCLDRDRAYRYGRRAAEAAGFEDEVNFPRIDVRSPNIPAIDFDAHEFERMARLVVYDVADAFRKIAHGKGVDFFYAVPADMMDAFIQARDCLPGMSATLGISLNQEQKIQGLVDHLNEAAEHGFQYLVKMNMAEINEAFEDWISRDVSVDSIVSMTAGGPK
jgi:hypothetical protein|nr:hypothetical protein [Neorhizobium tomejilense]